MLNGFNRVQKAEILAALDVLTKHGIAHSPEQAELHRQLLAEQATESEAQGNHNRTADLMDDAQNDGRY